MNDDRLRASGRKDRAADAFHHPFAYAAAQDVSSPPSLAAPTETS